MKWLAAAALLLVLSGCPWLREPPRGPMTAATTGPAALPDEPKRCPAGAEPVTPAPTIRTIEQVLAREAQLEAALDVERTARRCEQLRNRALVEWIETSVGY